MKVKKLSFLIALVISAISLGVFLVPFPAIFGKANDIALALFGSGFLVCVISLIEYFDERRRGIEEFYNASHEMISLMMRCKHYDSRFEPTRYVQEWLRVDEHGMHHINSAFGNLDFMFANGKLKRKAYDRIYSILLDRFQFVRDRRDRLSSPRADVQKSALLELNEEFFDHLSFGEQTVFGNAEKWLNVITALNELLDAAYFQSKGNS